MDAGGQGPVNLPSQEFFISKEIVPPIDEVVPRGGLEGGEAGVTVGKVVTVVTCDQFVTVGRVGTVLTVVICLTFMTFRTAMTYYICATPDEVGPLGGLE